MNKRFAAVAAAAMLACGAMAQDDDAPHARQMREMPAEETAPGADAIERAELEARGELFPLLKAGPDAAKAATPNIKPGGIVFGYVQNSAGGTYPDFYHWESLTHVGSQFVSFASDGTISTANENAWRNRDATLRAGGVAQAAGVKVIMVVLNSGFDVAVINTVMTTPAARTTLVDEIVALLADDNNVAGGANYSHGVSFDFEPFSWSSAARDGMALFFQELRSDLNAAGLASHEISLYGDPTPSDTQWGASSIGFAPQMDYLLYSGYDFASGLTPHAITDHNGALNNFDYYFDRGIAPEKFVYVISSYSRNWTGTAAYNVAGTSDLAEGFTDGLYDTTLNPRFGGPFAENYVTGDEVSWYTYNDGTNNHAVTFDSPQAMAVKVGSTLGYPSPGAWQGRRLGGVGFWSLMWMAETASWDPISNSAQAKTRTYPHIYQACQEILAPSGREELLVTGFEGLNFRWRVPTEGPDDVGDTDANSTRAIVSAPAGAGRPASTTNAMQLTFDIENGSVGTPGKLFFRHEMLAANEAAVQNSVIDKNAAIAFFDRTTKLTTSIYTSAAYPNATLRMVVMDNSRELERSPAFSLNGTGWRTIEWDLTDAATISGYNTNEPAFVDGDGSLDTASGGAKDIAFAGFILEATANNTNGAVVLDEVTHRHANAGGKDYKINEFRYDGNANEFVEIYGPAGALPAGFQLRTIAGSNGAITAKSVSGSIPNEGGGFGFFVVGDATVPNVDFSTGFAAGTDDLFDANPSGLQLCNATDGGVYDSVVYEAFGGMADLVRMQTLGVANEGAPWVGRVANGTDAAGVPHAVGRFPDGADANVNGTDFSLAKATPGAANGKSIPVGATRTFDFNTAPPEGFATFQTFVVGASGVGASPSGGNVHRCVDTTGGGAMSFLGDAALGSDGNGYRVRGEVFLPAAGASAQAVGVGFCASQGSAFFSSTRTNNSYENGYWLKFENSASGNLDDGIASHPGVVHFLNVTHDNQDGAPATSLGTRAATGGAWTTFEMSIDPHAAPASQLIAKIGGNTVYSGAIPAGGRTSGAVAFGYRKFVAGAATATEGTWVDNVRIEPIATTVVPSDGFAIR